MFTKRVVKHWNRLPSGITLLGPAPDSKARKTRCYYDVWLFNNSWQHILMETSVSWSSYNISSTLVSNTCLRMISSEGELIAPSRDLFQHLNAFSAKEKKEKEYTKKKKTCIAHT